MSWRKTLEKWKAFSHLDPHLQEQLNKMDDRDLENAFYKSLEFGTGGMRGELGAGTNRMNIYTVRKAAYGFGAYISTLGEEAVKRGVVIAYDSRQMSPEFALESAKTLATMGIRTYLFKQLRPTPELSFAVRFLNAAGGIVITASHNPPEYNGFKVYGDDGGQLTSVAAEQVIAEINKIENELTIAVLDEAELIDKGLIKMIGEEIDGAYIDKIITISENHLGPLENIKIVFTPLHGTGYTPLMKGLSALKYRDIYVVEEQAQPDPDFSTVATPNPEEKAAFELAIKKGREVDADILIATDPDADRLGIAVKNDEDDYVLLTGNQTGALLLHYILSEKKKKNTLPENGVMLKTIVTSQLGKEIARSFGVHTVDVLTGFKYIAEKIQQYEEDETYQFLFGYEESYGYLIGDFTRDKDAIQAALLAVELCAYYRQKNMTLYEALLALYEQYGYYKENIYSVTLKGKSGAEKIQQIMESFRKEPLKEIAGLKVVKAEDYEKGISSSIDGVTEPILLPKSNVIKYFLEDDSWICLRPSGTEPKIKFYFGVKGNSLANSEQKLASLMENWKLLIAEL